MLTNQDDCWCFFFLVKLPNKSKATLGTYLN